MDILQLHLVEQKIWSTDLLNHCDPISKQLNPLILPKSIYMLNQVSYEIGQLP